MLQGPLFSTLSLTAKYRWPAAVWCQLALHCYAREHRTDLLQILLSLLVSSCLTLSQPQWLLRYKWGWPAVQTCSPVSHKMSTAACLYWWFRIITFKLYFMPVRNSCAAKEMVCRGPCWIDITWKEKHHHIKALALSTAWTPTPLCHSAHKRPVKESWSFWPDQHK